MLWRKCLLPRCTEKGPPAIQSTTQRLDSTIAQWHLSGSTTFDVVRHAIGYETYAMTDTSSADTLFYLRSYRFFWYFDRQWGKQFMFSVDKETGLYHLLHLY